METQARVPVAAAGTAARRGPSCMQPKAVYMLVEEATLSAPRRGGLIQEQLWALLGPSVAFWHLSWELDQQLGERAPRKLLGMGDDRTCSGDPNNRVAKRIPPKGRFLQSESWESGFVKGAVRGGRGAVRRSRWPFQPAHKS